MQVVAAAPRAAGPAGRGPPARAAAAAGHAPGAIAGRAMRCGTDEAAAPRRVSAMTNARTRATAM